MPCSAISLSISSPPPLPCRSPLRQFRPKSLRVLHIWPPATVYWRAMPRRAIGQNRSCGNGCLPRSVEMQNVNLSVVTRLSHALALDSDKSLTVEAIICACAFPETRPRPNRSLGDANGIKSVTIWPAPRHCWGVSITVWVPSCSLIEIQAARERRWRA